MGRGRGYQDIKKEFDSFARDLDPAEEARIVVVGGPVGTAILPLTITPRGHDRILFTGIDEDDCRVAVMQHVSQLNLMLKAVKVGKKKARRIGFVITDENCEEE